MANIGIINGPNLNLLGTREPSVYGEMTLDEINEELKKHVVTKHTIRFYQNNCEGKIIDALQEVGNWAQGIIVNAGAYTHTSYAIRDTIASIGVPVVEVHLSNIHARESFRQNSVMAGVCLGQVSGFGWQSYLLGIYALELHLEK